MTRYTARDARVKMMAHMLNLDADGDDDEEEEENPNRIIRSHGMHKSSGGGDVGGHGNTRLPFGLCMQYGIELPEDATPGDAWKALEGKGISQKAAYKHLAEHGTIEGFKGSGKVAPATGKINPTEGLGEKKEKPTQSPVSEGNQPISEPVVNEGNQPITETQTVQEGNKKVKVKKDKPVQPAATETQNTEQAQQQGMATEPPADKKEQAKKAKQTKTATNTAKAEHEATLDEYRKDPLNTPYKAPQYNYKELSASIKEQMAIAKANGDKKAYKYWSGEMKTLNTMRRDDKTIKNFDKKVAKPAQEAKGKVQDSKTSPGAAAKVLSLVLAAMLGPIGAAMGALLLRDKNKKGSDNKGSNDKGVAVEKEEKGEANKKEMSQDQIKAEYARMSRQKERLDFEHEQAESAFSAGLDYGNLSFDENAFTAAKDKVTNSEFAKRNPNYMKYLGRDMDAYGKSMENLCGQIDAIRNNPDMSEAKKNAQLGKMARKCDNAVSRMDAGKYEFAEGRTKVYRYMTRNALTEISKSLKGEEK